MYDPGIDPELERICLRCLSRPMSERYLTAADLAADLRRAIDGRAAAAGPGPKRSCPRACGRSTSRMPGSSWRSCPGRDGATACPSRSGSGRTGSRRPTATKVFSVGLLYGPSGGGKSSFVKAGLVPNLERDRVRPVYVEATPSGTEARLLAELRREAPALPAESTCPTPWRSLRDDRERRSAAKLFLVLDQFEQWLQAHPDEPDAELVRALRQCDGRHVQALLLVRDDFWMAVTRFLRAVDVPLVQGGNAAAVELFDARHARKVLEGFGRAWARFPKPRWRHGARPAVPRRGGSRADRRRWAG